MTTRVKCQCCDNMILEATARRNDGLCVPCARDRGRSEFDRTVQGWIDNPETLPGTHGIPKPKDFALALAADQLKSRLFPTADDEMANFCNDYFEAARTKWSEMGSSVLTEKEKHSLAVWTFCGEVTNGGLVQYLDNESGAFANWSIDAFKAIGFPNYADAMKEVKQLFPQGVIPDSPDERLDALEAIGYKRIEALEERFWSKYLSDEPDIRKKLFQYLNT